ncbi:small ribosomal subunit protein uS14m-like [Amphiura filiformis]|uniref:small ribosomal subunit protein uS14m-like n=1 Tax=Amphiura filiformis TaxID=82378 RepID=UPI003B20C4CE
MATPMAKHGLTIAVNLRQNVHHIGCLQNISALLMPRCAVQTTCPLRTNYADWRMRRDAIRRQLTKEHSQERRLLNCIRKNTILPDEVKVMADQEIASLPRDSSYVRIRNRCAITSRSRGVVQRWRLSRIVWRQEADANHMSGVQRAKW